MPAYTLTPAETTDTPWSRYNSQYRSARIKGFMQHVHVPGARAAAQARAARLHISVVVEKDGRPWRIVHPDGKSERLDLGAGRGGFRGRPGHRRAKLVAS
jgi:hypothetical protein